MKPAMTARSHGRTGRQANAIQNFVGIHVRARRRRRRSRRARCRAGPHPGGDENDPEDPEGDAGATLLGQGRQREPQGPVESGLVVARGVLAPGSTGRVGGCRSRSEEVLRHSRVPKVRTDQAATPAAARSGPTGSTRSARPAPP